MNFWKDISKPVFALAPMEDVTDTVFREVVMSVSDPEVLNVLYTEFTSTEGMAHEQGRTKVMERIVVNESEIKLLQSRGTRLVAQIWGSDPAKFVTAARQVEAMGVFSGIDINMGCPVKKVIKNKSCSALINHPALAREIIQATRAGTQLPVSVKTRLGFKTVITEDWIGNLLEASPAAIIIHGRTQKMMSYGQAMWDEIGKAVELRNRGGYSTVIIGNGDVSSYKDALDKIRNTGVDGVMVGTGVFKNPWIFNKLEREISFEEKTDLLLYQVKLFESTWGKNKNFNVLKRFFKIYLNGFRGAVEWRDKLMHASDYSAVYELVKELKKEAEMLQPVQI